MVIKGINYPIELDGLPARLQTENAGQFTSPTKITYSGWLTSRKVLNQAKAQSADLLIELSNDRTANRLVHYGLVYLGRTYSCSLYDNSHRIQQCFKCQQYKHIARYCRRPNACAYRAVNHPTSNCPTSRDRDHARCAVCIQHLPQDSEELTQHFAFDRECPVRKERVAEARYNRANGPKYFMPTRSSVPFILSVEPPDMEEKGRDPTPAEAVSAAPAEEASEQPSRRSTRLNTRSMSRVSMSKKRSGSQATNKKARTQSAGGENNTESVMSDVPSVLQKTSSSRSKSKARASTRHIITQDPMDTQERAHDSTEEL